MAWQPHLIASNDDLISYYQAHLFGAVKFYGLFLLSCSNFIKIRVRSLIAGTTNKASQSVCFSYWINMESKMHGSTQPKQLVNKWHDIINKRRTYDQLQPPYLNLKRAASTETKSYLRRLIHSLEMKKWKKQSRNSKRRESVAYALTAFPFPFSFYLIFCPLLYWETKWYLSTFVEAARSMPSNIYPLVTFYLIYLNSLKLTFASPLLNYFKSLFGYFAG